MSNNETQKDKDRQFWGRFSRRRDVVVGRVVDSWPFIGRVASALPAKTLTLVTFGGTVSVIYATEPRVTLWTMGATCGAMAASCETLSLRAPVDQDIVATFSPIMLGTLRQKMRGLHVILQSLATGFACLGAIFISMARAHDHLWHWFAMIQGITSTAHDFLAFFAVVLLIIQVVVTSRGDDDETVGHFAHDAVCCAHILSLLGAGIHTFSTSMVAIGVFLVWLSNAVQVHQMYARPSQGQDDVPYLPAASISGPESIIFSV